MKTSYLLHDPHAEPYRRGFVNQRGRAGFEPTSRLYQSKKWIAVYANRHIYTCSNRLNYLPICLSAYPLV